MLAKLNRTLRWLESGLLVLLLTGLIGLAAYQVVARNFFSSGLLYGDALVRVLVLWVTMIGATVAARRDEHIRIDVLLRVLPEPVRRQVRRVSLLFTAAVCGVFAYYSAVFVRYEYEDGAMVLSGLPAWICELVIPAGALVLMLRYLLHAVRPS